MRINFRQTQHGSWTETFRASIFAPTDQLCGSTRTSSSYALLCSTRRSADKKEGAYDTNWVNNGSASSYETSADRTRHGAISSLVDHTEPNSVRDRGKTLQRPSSKQYLTPGIVSRAPSFDVAEQSNGKEAMTRALQMSSSSRTAFGEVPSKASRPTAGTEDNAITVG